MSALRTKLGLLRQGIFCLGNHVQCCHTKIPTAESTQFPRQPLPASVVWRKPPRYYGQPAPCTHPHLLQDGEVTPGITASEYRERRYHFMDHLGRYCDKIQHRFDGHIVVFPSATKKYMIDKIPYQFRQNTDFLYLTGCLEPDSALVLCSLPETNLPEHVSTLFVRKPDPHAELWDGPRTGIDGVRELLGIDQALPLEELEHFLECFMRDNREFMLWYDYMYPPHPEIHKSMRDFMECLHRNFETPKQLLQEQRLIKSPAEIELMKRSCETASEAITTTIQASHPLVTEHQLFAKVDYECRIRGAEYLAYPPVVAGGNRANIIHYINNNQRIMPGEMVLMDAGCEYHGYTSDVTRTWPVSGRFSSAQQDVYEAVFEVQADLIQLCASRASIDQLFNSMCQLLGQKLKDLCILPEHYTDSQLARAAYCFCPHHVSHYLGMDVHDTPLIPRTRRLQSGMVITVEPGLYINESNTTAPTRYRGIGVRIEDDVLITEDGPVVLTAKCPKRVEDIEKLFGTAHPSQS